MNENITVTHEQMLMKIGELTVLNDAMRSTINRQAQRIQELEEKEGGKKK